MDQSREMHENGVDNNQNQRSSTSPSESTSQQPQNGLEKPMLRRLSSMFCSPKASQHQPSPAAREEKQLSRKRVEKVAHIFSLLFGFILEGF
jgi:hypothetical protein